MPSTFALPLTLSSARNHAHPTSTPSTLVRFSNLPNRKRKRLTTKSTSNTSSEEEAVSSSSPSSDEEEDEFHAHTNPLSLSQAEIAQRKLAGLKITASLPSEHVKDFPHRGLPIELPVRGRTSKNKSKRTIKGKERTESYRADRNAAIEEDEDDSEEERQRERAKVITRPDQGPRLRLQHFSVLTTILHRCLHEGDLERVNRAWAMLIRMQISGQPMDLRSSGYWGIGAELLIKSLDGKRRRRRSHSSGSDDSEAGSEADDEQRGSVKKRWGTKEGMERAKEYYERLILQYPYKRQHDTSVSALDFWPAMVGCEIYGIEYERKSALAKIKREDDADDNDARSRSDSESSSEAELEEEYPSEVRRLSRRSRRRAERRWVARDEIRRTALEAAEKLAARLDELMGTPPYSDSHDMLKLRGNIALWVGDLSVPAPNSEGKYVEGSDKSIVRDVDARHLMRDRRREHEKGLERQKTERKRAQRLFGRVVKEKGDLAGIKHLEIMEDEDEPHGLEQ